MHVTESIRRWYNPIPRQPEVPLIGLGDGTDAPVAVAQIDIASLRGVSESAADVSECTCPEPCERDHANE